MNKSLQASDYDLSVPEQVAELFSARQQLQKRLDALEG